MDVLANLYTAIFMFRAGVKKKNPVKTEFSFMLDCSFLQFFYCFSKYTATFSSKLIVNSQSQFVQPYS